VFLETILVDLPMHQSATAYQSGSSIKQNAKLHRNSRVTLKLDFEAFFPSITTSAWKRFVSKQFPHWSSDDLLLSMQILFWGQGGTKPKCLSIGAPTSPLVSNALMYDFDCRIFGYAEEHSLIYSRYADDIAISSKEFLDKEGVIKHILHVIRELKQPVLRLNKTKTKLVSKATSRRLTGLILTNDERVSLGRERKRAISAMVHKAISGTLNKEELPRLSGLLSFAYDVEPTFLDTLERKYGKENILKLKF
jgi:retron-type reverse transcriptase